MSKGFDLYFTLRAFEKRVIKMIDNTETSFAPRDASTGIRSRLDGIYNQMTACTQGMRLRVLGAPGEYVPHLLSGRFLLTLPKAQTNPRRSKIFISEPPIYLSSL